MKYITIPQSVSISVPQPDNKFVIVVWGFVTEFLVVMVWPHISWTSSEKRIEMFQALHAKFDGAVAGDVVELTDAEYEAFLPRATLVGEKERAPHLAVPLSHLMLAVYQATAEAPAAKE